MMQSQQHKTFTYKNTSFISHRNSMNIHQCKTYMNYRNLSRLRAITLPSLLSTPIHNEYQLIPYGLYFKVHCQEPTPDASKNILTHCYCDYGYISNTEAYFWFDPCTNITVFQIKSHCIAYTVARYLHHTNAVHAQFLNICICLCRDFLSCSRGLVDFVLNAWLDEHMLENLAVKRECQKLITTTEHLSFSYLSLANFNFPFNL